MTERSPDALAARALALEILGRVEGENAHADVALAEALARCGLATRDRAFATRLVYGTLAWQGRLDWCIAELAERDPKTLDPQTRRLLRLGVYQIVILDRVPPHAAVGTSVDLAKRLAPAAAGLVNAVLRRAVREGRSVALPDPVTAPLRHLAVAFSHPEWLVGRWRACFPDAALRALLAADNEAAPTVLRSAPGARESLMATLHQAGVSTQPGCFAPDALIVESSDPHALPGFADGRFSVQSEGSQLVALLVRPEPGMRVLDACAAPGGKATYLAQLLRGTGLVVALARRRAGARAIARAARRLGISRLLPVAADARRAADIMPAARFDRILVDAPCSGFGTLRSHPEVRWRRTPADLARLARMQHAILEGVTPLLAAGGALVYATCTMSDEENDDVVRAWLAGHSDLALEDARPSLPSTARRLVGADGALRTYPHRDGLDGFYAVRIRRQRETHGCDVGGRVV